jgi:transposase
MVEAGASRHEAADHFGISVSSAVKWMQRWNESKIAAPKPREGSVSPLENQAERVLAVITDRPNLTLEDLSQSSDDIAFEPAAARARALFFTGTTSP